jgi:DNA-binding NarL/FixJ family response regulator
VLVVDGEFLTGLDPEEFYKAVDFGLGIRVLVELEELHFAEAAHLIRIGCAGYISKTASPEQAGEALRAVLAGELWASRRIVSSVLLNVLRESRHGLTFRESEILSLVSEGLKNSEIAERLCISPQTVRWHLRGVYSKLGTHDRLRVVIRAPLGEARSSTATHRTAKAAGVSGGAGSLLSA